MNAMTFIHLFIISVNVNNYNIITIYVIVNVPYHIYLTHNYWILLLD